MVTFVRYARHAMALGMSGGLDKSFICGTFDRWGNTLTRSTLNSAGSITVYEYDANNLVIRVKEPDGNGEQSANSSVSDYYYDRLGRKIAARDQNGNVNMQRWDAAGNLAEEIHADGGVVRYSFNAFGEEIARRDAENNLTTLRRDDLGRIVAVAAPFEATTAKYDEAGRAVSRTNGAGAESRYSVDLQGNTTAVHTPTGAAELSAYNPQGHRIAREDANGAVETWHYDADGRLQGHKDIGGAEYSYDYDSAGQLVRQTNTRGQDIRTSYDSAGQVTQVRDIAEDKTTQYAYNLAGQHTRELTVQKGVLYQDNLLAFDSLGRLARIDALADRVSVLMEYDKVGNLVHQRESEQAHDAGTLLQQVRIDGQVHTVARGLASVAGGQQDLWYAYDNMNRQVLIEGAVNGDVADAHNVTEAQGHVVGYDKNGNRISDTYQGSQLVAQLGADGQTRYVIHKGQITMYYRYDAAGRLSEVAVGAIDMQGNALDPSSATVVSQNYYDGAGRLFQSGPGNKLPAGYANAALANPTEAFDTDVTLRTYDAGGRLQRERITSLNGALVRDTSYAGGYDLAGNVLSYSVTDSNGSVASTQVSQVKLEDYKRASIVTTNVAPNGVAAISSGTYAYDTSGNMVQTTTTSAKGVDTSRELRNDVAGNILQTKEGNVVLNRLVVDGRTYAVWQGVATMPVTFAPMRARAIVAMTMGGQAADAISSVSSSNDSAVDQITQLYHSLLKRAPDDGGLAFWVSALEGGLTIGEIEEAFKTTDEYLALQNGGGTPIPDPGPTPAELVTDSYQSLLGRPPTSSDIAYWTKAMANGLTTAEVDALIKSSPEYINREATRPDSGNFDAYGNAIISYKSGETLQSLAQQAYGNPGLWYVIAGANGVVSNGDLANRTSLIVPDRSNFADLRGDGTDGRGVVSIDGRTHYYLSTGQISNTDVYGTVRVSDTATGQEWIEDYIPAVSLLDPIQIEPFDAPKMRPSDGITIHRPGGPQPGSPAPVPSSPGSPVGAPSTSPPSGPADPSVSGPQQPGSIDPSIPTVYVPNTRPRDQWHVIGWAPTYTAYDQMPVVNGPAVVVKDSKHPATALTSSQILAGRKKPVNYAEAKIDEKNKKIDITVKINYTKPSLAGRILGLASDVSDAEFASYTALANAGIEKYWSRTVDLDGVEYKVNVTAQTSATGMSIGVANPGFAGCGNASSRSRNPGMGLGAIYYDVTQPQYADALFSLTAAHEIGHSFLSDAGGREFSFGHQGTSSVAGNINETAPKYPTAGEIGLMPYYNFTEEVTTNDVIQRTIASDNDTKSLIYISGRNGG